MGDTSRTGRWSEGHKEGWGSTREVKKEIEEGSMKGNPTGLSCLISSIAIDKTWSHEHDLIHSDVTYRRSSKFRLIFPWFVIIVILVVQPSVSKGVT